ncbi:hypothetical protein A2a_00031 [Klebsiella phage VLCpiA2a]|nr:hypothetical protein A2a_00031 [Klebsiella phage VLCpiA2a]UVX31911.1 hypothetical protein A2a_b_00004 [Klebsiella phage VLCpiA2a]UVX32003.1 hypothetical protein A2b_00043 [Klebsiella phage VLCpiA2b]
MFLFKKTYTTHDGVIVEVSIFEDTSVGIISETFLGAAIYRNHVCLDVGCSEEDILQAIISGIAKVREVSALWI